MLVGGEVVDMTPAIVRAYQRHRLDALVCLGGGGTAKNAMRLVQAGLNVITLPKTIDNDVVKTDATFGYATALDIATDAIDRLHSTAHSHHRIIVVEIMGHRAGWLTLGAGIAGGADVILIPEIPYAVQSVADAIAHRVRTGSNFSIVAVAEGARDTVQAAELGAAEARKRAASTVEETAAAVADLAALEAAHAGNTLRLAAQLEALTGLESRVTILGYVQRGGTPSAADRLLATRLGSAGADLIAEGTFGVMVAARGEGTEPVRAAIRSSRWRANASSCRRITPGSGRLDMSGLAWATDGTECGPSTSLPVPASRRASLRLRGVDAGSVRGSGG